MDLGRSNRKMKTPLCFQMFKVLHQQPLPPRDPRSMQMCQPTWDWGHTLLCFSRWGISPLIAETRSCGLWIIRWRNMNELSGKWLTEIRETSFQKSVLRHGLSVCLNMLKWFFFFKCVNWGFCYFWSHLVQFLNYSRKEKGINSRWMLIAPNSSTRRTGWASFADFLKKSFIILLFSITALCSFR